LQSLQHLGQEAIGVPFVKKPPDGLPGAELLGQIPPGSTGAKYPEDSVEDRASIAWRSTGRLLFGEKIFDAFPCVIREEIASHGDAFLGVRVMPPKASQIRPAAERPVLRQCLVLQRMVALPSAGSEVGEPDAGSTKFPTRRLRVALASLGAATLRVRQLLGGSFKQACSNSCRKPQAPHHRRHRRPHLAHRQLRQVRRLRVFPPEAPGAFSPRTSDSPRSE
jgi:hypothetical protein